MILKMRNEIDVLLCDRRCIQYYTFEDVDFIVVDAVGVIGIDIIGDPC